ncbi:class I SAM-dependent methyltransferase [Petrachloros mirabilis]
MQDSRDLKMRSDCLLTRFIALPMTLLAVVLWSTLVWDTPVSAQHTHKHDRMPNVTEYLDRLDRPERDVDQKPDEVVSVLALKPGMHVADLGSGSGYFTKRFVQAVTETGMVYAIDVEPQALEFIRGLLDRARQPYTVEFIRAEADDPNLPVQSVDLVFVCNTYHHLEDRPMYFRNLRTALKPGGRIAIVDFYHDDRSGELGFSKQHLVPRDTVLREMSEAGYRLVREHDFLPKQYFMEFAP